MMTTHKKHLIVELVATAIASPALMVFLSRAGAWKILWLLGWPLLMLTQVCLKWINAESALGGWIDQLVALLLLCILVWMILFGVARLIEALVRRKKREA